MPSLRSFLLVLSFAIIAGCGQFQPVSRASLPVEALSRVTSVAPYELRDERGVAVEHTHVMLAPRLAAMMAPFTNANDVTYHGGAVQTHPEIYVVFWGYVYDPSNEAKSVTAFLKAVGGTQWLGDVTQYYQMPRKIHVSNHGAELKGVWYDKAGTVPFRPTDRQVRQEAIRLAKHFNVFTVNASLIVATPMGHDTPGFGTNWCAYHGAVFAAGMHLSYTNLPYYAPNGPCTGAVSPPNFLNAAAHEVAESQTDPVPGLGWLDAKGAEIGDKCETNFASMVFGPQRFYVQSLWSNRAGTCVF